MTTERVVIKDFSGDLLIRWMVGRTGRVAYVTDDDGAAAVKAGLTPEYVVGFPLSDVYKWNVQKSIRQVKCRNWAVFTRRF
jgi:hypothetical protein